MEIISSCVQVAMEFVPSNRILLFGFSQGACSVLSYACRSGAPRLGAVVALSGALCGEWRLLLKLTIYVVVFLVIFHVLCLGGVGSDNEITDDLYPATQLSGVPVSSIVFEVIYFLMFC
jgi:pimeloyl-ACP methyl ester carboxylesterase